MTNKYDTKKDKEAMEISDRFAF